MWLTLNGILAAPGLKASPDISRYTILLLNGLSAICVNSSSLAACSYNINGKLSSNFILDLQKKSGIVSLSP